MKQVVEVKVTFQIDYDNPELVPHLKEKLETSSMEQIKADIREMLFCGIKELVDEDMKGDSIPGLTYYVEDVSV